MNRFSIALIAMAAAVAISPNAMAGSWKYNISGSNFTSVLNLTGTDAGLVPCSCSAPAFLGRL